MSSLVLMYVYFDENCDIKAITPTLDVDLSAQMQHTLVSLKEVEPFLLGTSNPFDYTIKSVQTAAGPGLRLVKKYVMPPLHRSVDAYLSKISNSSRSAAIVQIVARTDGHNIVLTLNSAYKVIHTSGTFEEKDVVAEFIEAPTGVFHITEKNNPYNHLFSFELSNKQLFDREVIYIGYPETVDLRNSSVYTKQTVSNYSYNIQS